MFDEIYDKLAAVSYGHVGDSLIDLLEQTWSQISRDVCFNHLKTKIPLHEIRERDLVHVELRADEARSAVYSNMFMWKNTSQEWLLNEWLEMNLEEQNVLLTEAFPANRVYGV